MRKHCPRCGGFTSPQPENRSLLMTRAGLPLPPAGDLFASFHAASLDREAEAKRRGVTRQIGAERRARYAFTHQCRGGVQ